MPHNQPVRIRKWVVLVVALFCILAILPGPERLNMTDQTTTKDDGVPTWDTEEILPGGDPDAHALFEEIRGQLDDPRTILANALYRVHRADDEQAQIDHIDRDKGSVTSDEELGRLMDRRMDLTDRRRAHLEGADVLARIAEVAQGMQVATIAPEVDDLLHAAEAVPMQAEPERPQPVRGVRFQAVLTGGRMGVVGGRDWLFDPAWGFLDITDAEQVGTPNGLRYEISGRIVSGTPAYILGVTDGGTSVALPRMLVVESPDE